MTQGGRDSEADNSLLTIEHREERTHEGISEDEELCEMHDPSLLMCPMKQFRIAIDCSKETILSRSRQTAGETDRLRPRKYQSLAMSTRDRSAHTARHRWHRWEGRTAISDRLADPQRLGEESETVCFLNRSLQDRLPRSHHHFQFQRREKSGHRSGHRSLWSCNNSHPACPQNREDPPIPNHLLV